ncbi:MAG TPA: hypothetical protein VK518_16120 [Puia sp.]|nr:hypothetical protein [Puia sp.]
MFIDKTMVDGMMSIKSIALFVIVVVIVVMDGGLDFGRVMVMMWGKAMRKYNDTRDDQQPLFTP